MTRNVFIILLIIVIFLVVILLLRKKIYRTFMGYEPTWDSNTNAVISKLHPDLRPLASNFINDLDANHGIKLRAYSGLRTFDEQKKLYAQGRTEPGSIVTNAQPGYSYHNYGLAFDAVEIKNGQAVWNNPNWTKIGQIARQHGLEWGGNWTSFKDMPHFQLTKGIISSLLAKYTSGQVDNNGYIIV